MASSRPGCVAFIVEWFDSIAGMVREFRMNFYADNTLDLIQSKNNQTFLKRTYTPQIQWSDLYIGNSVTVFSRQLHITAFADEGTANFFEENSTRRALLVCPGSIARSGSILRDLRALEQASFSLARSVRVDGACAAALGVDKGHGVLVEVVCSSQAAKNFDALCDRHADHVRVCRDRDAISQLKALPRPSPSHSLVNRSACIIKPHAVTDGSFADVLDAIFGAGFHVDLLELVHLDKECSANFFDVYKGVLPQYSAMVSHMSEAPVMFLEVSGASDGIIEEFREFCGPADVEVARVLRPESLRARFGQDLVKNAVHCTDLPTDGSLECQYLRHVLQI